MRIYCDSVILMYFFDHTGPFNVRATSRLAALAADFWKPFPKMRLANRGPGNGGRTMDMDGPKSSPTPPAQKTSQGTSKMGKIVGKLGNSLMFLADV